MPERSTITPRPLQAIAGFAAYLREHGYRVGIPEQQAMLQAALRLDIAEFGRVEACWRSLMCSEPSEWRRFPELFASYWFPERLKGSARDGRLVRPRRDMRQLVVDLHAVMDRDDSGAGATPGVGVADLATMEARDSEHAQGGASRSEATTQRNFRDWQAEEMSLLERIVEDVARRMRSRLMRRHRLDARGRMLDLRKTLRGSLRTGGIPFEPAWLKRRHERPRLFILVDVSRSMELYARLFLHIARAFASVLRARVFIFHTRLAEITPLLQRPSSTTQDKIAAMTAGFGSGTRIASSLDNFVSAYARGALSRFSRVVVMSDGFDSDEEHQLARALAAIRAKGARIYWLHPSRDVPQASALAPCSGIISAFAPVYNIESLSNLDILIR